MMASFRRGDGRRKLTPPEIAKLFGVSPDKVLVWIRSGELRAIDAATKPGGRPRYLVDVEDLRAFERRRQVQPTPVAKSRRRRTQDADIKEFF